MKKSLLLLMLMAFLLPWALNAQTIVTIGKGTATSNSNPIGTYYNYSITEQLYTAAEIGMAGDISSISFYFMGIATKDLPITVYMKHVDDEDLASAGISLADADEVFNGSLSVTTTAGWVTINLATPFAYDGTSNLLIGVIKDYLYYFSGQSWQGTATSATMARYTQNDNNAYTTSTTPSDAQSNRPNIQLGITPSSGSSCEKPSSLVASDVEAHGATLTWAGGSGSYNVEYKKAADEEWTSALANTALLTTSLSNLDAATNYQARVQSICGSETSGWKTVSFTTECDVVSSFPWSVDFNGLTAGIPVCWDNSEGTTTSDSYKWSYYATGHDGAGLRFDSYYNTDGNTNFLKTPVISLPSNKNMRLSFWYKNPTGGDFSVYISTDEGATHTTPLSTGLTSVSNWTKHAFIDLSDYAGQDVVIVFKGTSNYGSGDAYIYLDDIIIEEIPGCLEPAGLAVSSDADAIGPNSIKLQFTAGESNESAWKLQYKKIADSEWTTITDAITENPFELEGLEASTQYDIRVAAWCDPSNPDGISGYTEPIQVATECEAVTVFPISYGFETSEGFPSNASTPTTNQIGTCWLNEATLQNGSNSTRVWGTSTTYKHEGSQALILPDKGHSTNFAKTMLVFPEMLFTSERGYTVSFWIYRNGTSANPEGFKVYISDTDTISPNAVELGHYSRNYGIAYPVIESASGWYQYEIAIPKSTMTGNVFLIFEGQSYYGSGTYVDDILIEPTPTCKKPSALMLEKPSSRTAHTATLKWTAGEEGQNAWQIAVDTLASFDPDSVGIRIIDVTNDTAIVDGLLANKQYYAYVRANCGNNDFSAWSTAKASFKTLVGNAAPTNLAVIASTITSSEAMVSWKGVKTNDNHVSFDVYYSRFSTMPEPLAADSLIENVTDTFYLFQNLDAEKTYYVWVRDNCGEDGLSAWSSRASFTTAASCQTPDGLAANEIGVDSAIISWTTYGLTDFNLRYKADTAGAAWSDPVAVAQPYILSGLAANMAYKVQVQPTCAEVTVWSDSMSFRTDCGAIDVAAIAYSEDFNKYVTSATSSYAPTTYPNDVLPECWHFLNRSETSSSYPQVFLSSYSAYAVSGNCLFFKSSSATPLYAILPEFVENTGDLQIKFSYRNEGTGASNGTLYVGYMTDPSNAATFVSVETCEQTATKTAKEIMLTGAPDDSYIAFKYEGGSANNYYLSIDNVVVEEIPSCLKPTGLASSNITANSATLSWAAGNNQWQYAVVEVGQELEWNGNVVADTFVTVQNLKANTPYNFYVRAYCSATDQSDSIMLNFRTECAAISTLPWNEDFEKMDADIVPLCWDNSASSSSTITSNPERIWGVYSYGENKMIRMYNFYVQSGTAIINSPIIELPSDKPCVFEFDYSHTASCGNFDVKISSDGGNTFTSLKSYAKTSTGTSYTDPGTFKHAKINLAAYAGQSVILQFFANADYSQGAIFIDNVKVKAAETCSVIVNASRYATFYSDEAAYVMPQGLIGYAFTIDEHLSDPFYGAEGGLAPIVPAGTPLVLEGDAGTYSLVPSLAAGTELTLDNDLFGVNDTSIVGSASDGNVYYVLSLAAGAEPDYNSVGFYYMLEDGKGGFELPAHKAYLVVDNPSSAPAAFYLFNGENNATWLENLEGVEGTVKFMHEGNIYILRDSIIYDATGRKVRELK